MRLFETALYLRGAAAMGSYGFACSANDESHAIDASQLMWMELEMETAPLTSTRLPQEQTPREQIPREHPRHSLLERASISFGNEDSQVEAKDISFGGLSISGLQGAAMGAEGRVRFSPSVDGASKETQDIWLEVRVRWVRGDEAGLMFLGSTREQRRAIEVLVQSAAHPRSSL